MHTGTRPTSWKHAGRLIIPGGDAVKQKTILMPVPDFQSLMLPTLKALADGTEARISEVRACIAAVERLTSEDLGEMLSSGRELAGRSGSSD